MSQDVSDCIHLAVLVAQSFEPFKITKVQKKMNKVEHVLTRYMMEERHL